MLSMRPPSARSWRPSLAKASGSLTVLGSSPQCWQFCSGSANKRAMKTCATASFRFALRPSIVVSKEAQSPLKIAMKC